METSRRDISHIKITAAVAMLVVVGVGIWQVVVAFEDKNTTETFAAASIQQSGAQNAAVATTSAGGLTGEDPVSQLSTDALGELIGTYAGLQESGKYSTSTADQDATAIGMGLSAPVTYSSLTLAEIPTSSDTSYQAMMNYRAALQTTLKPLLQNTQPEYELFGMYVQTGEQSYLDQLSEYASTYESVASSTAQITVPEDAAQVQLGLVNSMYEFAAVLNALVAHANDPIASTVLLENYNQSQSDLVSAFQALVTYEQSKTQ